MYCGVTSKFTMGQIEIMKFSKLLVGYTAGIKLSCIYPVKMLMIWWNRCRKIMNRNETHGEIKRLVHLSYKKLVNIITSPNYEKTKILKNTILFPKYILHIWCLLTVKVNTYSWIRITLFSISVYFTICILLKRSVVNCWFVSICGLLSYFRFPGLWDVYLKKQFSSWFKTFHVHNMYSNIFWTL